MGLFNYFAQQRSQDRQMKAQREQGDLQMEEQRDLLERQLSEQRDQAAEQREALLSIEREKQLRERSLIVAGDFAGGAMDVLAHLRRYRPTKYGGHRNEGLHSDTELLRKRAESVSLSLDELRAMRGRVWLFFPGRSTKAERKDRGPATTADWGEVVVARLQAMQNVCGDFWRHCEQHPGEREAQERVATAAYRAARSTAWQAVDQFAVTAASRVRGSA